jgi:hypothetical protein
MICQKLNVNGVLQPQESEAGYDQVPDTRDNGTQAEKDATGALKVTAWINPFPDCTVKHQEKEYVVFIPEDPNGDPLAFKKECHFFAFPRSRRVGTV